MDFDGVVGLEWEEVKKLCLILPLVLAILFAPCGQQFDNAWITERIHTPMSKEEMG